MTNELPDLFSLAGLDTVSGDGPYTHTYTVQSRHTALDMLFGLDTTRYQLRDVQVEIKGGVAEVSGRLAIHPADYWRWRQQHRAAWWRALPRGSKRALRRRGVKG